MATLGDPWVPIEGRSLDEAGASGNQAAEPSTGSNAAFKMRFEAPASSVAPGLHYSKASAIARAAESSSFSPRSGAIPLGSPSTPLGVTARSPFEKIRSSAP